MKNYPNLAIAFLKIILWISFVSAIIGLTAIVISFTALLFDFNYPIFNSVKITMGQVQTTLSEIKNKGILIFVLFCIAAIYYLWLFIQLTNNALNILDWVNFHKPFNAEISNLISKLGSAALKIGILNILFNTIIPLLYGERFILDFNFENFNFLIVSSILYIISIIFQKGAELQSENDLTI